MLPERPYRKYTDILSNFKRQIAMGLDREQCDEPIRTMTNFEPCPNCSSHRTYEEHGDLHCWRCGEINEESRPRYLDSSTKQTNTVNTRADEHTFRRLETFIETAQEYDHISTVVDAEYRPKYRRKAFTYRRMARERIGFSDNVTSD